MYILGLDGNSRIDYVQVGDGFLKFQITADGPEGVQIETGIVHSGEIADLVVGKSDAAIMHGEMGGSCITVTIDQDLNLVFSCARIQIRVPVKTLFPALKAG